ncbi:helix-turn-helix domain-containing protein [Algoriphagus sp. AGSA1]|uniref:helix-turn-helix domain-containing protein n=1 Tax=Algoriphagus sp. AGSA1 TaxID=2907213 RepID=UPI001F421533|nr:helix-turn-helix domain-containing protein [Algoriphagus sp. AGSA1]MCE7058133.1 helix-turn-helix domain-containing protein [Algoriphagus sp. AGSA1]
MIQTVTKIHRKIKTEVPSSSAAKRISTDFLKLLESQFPITDLRTNLKLRSASDFAEKLCVHVNHLNRTVNAIFNKPTSVIIRDRILVESKRLLEQSDWNVSEISYALGFTEVTHFNNFFKKAMNMNPTQYRKSLTETKT